MPSAESAFRRAINSFKEGTMEDKKTKAAVEGEVAEADAEASRGESVRTDYLLRQRAIEYTRAQSTFIKSMNKFIKNISLIRLEAFVFGTIFGVFLMFLLHL